MSRTADITGVPSADAPLPPRSTSAYVYFLVHRTEPRFKIGKALSVSARASQLGIRTFDLEKSWAASVPDAETAQALEKVLHKLLARFQILPDEHTDGFTEWFHEDALSRALAIVERDGDLVNATLHRYAEVVPQPNLQRRRAPARPRYRSEPPSREELLHRNARTIRAVMVWIAGIARHVTELYEAEDFYRMRRHGCDSDTTYLVYSAAPFRNDSERLALRNLISSLPPDTLSIPSGGWTHSYRGDGMVEMPRVTLGRIGVISPAEVVSTGVLPPEAAAEYAQFLGPLAPCPAHKLRVLRHAWRDLFVC